MKHMRWSFWAYLILSLVFVNELSAKPAKSKKGNEKAAAPAAEAPLSKNPESSPVPSAEPAAAPSASSSTEMSCGSWNQVQLGGGAMFDSDGGKAGALSVTWNPTYNLASSLSLKGYLGGVLANVFVGSGFGIGDLGLVLKYDFSPSFSVEAGGGFQYWTGTRLRNTFSQIKAGIGFKPFIITYSSVFDSLATTHQVIGAISIEL